MVKVFIVDRVHKGHVVLRCPQEVMYIISEPIQCRLLDTSMELRIEVSGFMAFLMSLFRIKPPVVFYREPGIYDVIVDRNEMIIHGVVEIKGNSIAIHPDIVFKDMAEYKEVSRFVQDTYSKFLGTLKNVLDLASVIATAPLSYINNIIDSTHGAVAMVQELGRHNVKIMELANTALSGANVSLDEVIRAVNEILSKGRWLLAPPPPTQAFQAPPIPPLPPMPQQSPQQQQQGQQQGGA
jgi:hypothetical protein